MVLIQGGLMGAMAHASGTLTGLGLSLILVYVINRQSFGWTIQFHPEPITVLLAGGAAVVIAGLAAVWPAIVASRKPVAEALRYE
jgi:putative ABC transport system permease protein